MGGLVKSPNRWRWLAHGLLNCWPNRWRWLAHGVGSGGFLREVTSETPIAVATLETEFPVRFRFLFGSNYHDLRRFA
jgi:hypothetical protein